MQDWGYLALGLWLQRVSETKEWVAELELLQKSNSPKRLQYEPWKQKPNLQWDPRILKTPEQWNVYLGSFQPDWEWSKRQCSPASWGWEARQYKTFETRWFHHEHKMPDMFLQNLVMCLGGFQSYFDPIIFCCILILLLWNEMLLCVIVCWNIFI